MNVLCIRYIFTTDSLFFIEVITTHLGFKMFWIDILLVFKSLVNYLI